MLRISGYRPPLTALALVAGAALLSGCNRQPALSDSAYREVIVAFNTGLAAMQTSQEVLARQQFDRVIALAPHEPAGWADVGLLLLRQQELEAAGERLVKAAELAPESADIQRLLALSLSRRGNLPEAVSHWKRALELRPDDPKAAYALALDLERQATPESLADAQRTLETLAKRSGNLVAQLEYARIAAKRGDAAALQQAVSAMSGPAAAWPDDIRERFQSVQDAAASNPRAAGQRIAFLKNVLMWLPDYRRWLADVSTPREEVGEPIERFLVLENPKPQPAPPDESLSISVQAAADLPAAVGEWVDAAALRTEGQPVAAVAGGNGIRLSNGVTWTAKRSNARRSTRPGNAASSIQTVGVAADLNYDFRTDFVISNADGLTLLRQQEDGTFADVTAEAKLPRDVLASSLAGLWDADVDTDGDLDIVAAPVDGAVRVLRNNGDDTFAAQEPFAGATAARAFAWADVDGDGVPDAALIDRDGTARVFINARGGSFRASAAPAGLPQIVAIAAAEVTGDAIMDLVAAGADGRIVSLSLSPDGRTWNVRDVGHVRVGNVNPGEAALLAADLDNNGATDVVLGTSAGSFVLLRGADGAARALGRSVPMSARAAADLDGDGRLDLVGQQADGHVVIGRNTGQRRYHWQVLRPHAATVTGDQRINSFGVGGEVEVRTGLHVQRQPIDGAIVHVGLGEATSSEVVRIMWPNGALQSEFNVPADASVAATQRLKGSCPWLFAWNGSEMAFVTDVLWRSPLGLRINAQTTADVLMTEDWVKVRGDQLRARDGAYDLRITAELWETHFFDLASLLVIDHPRGTEVFVDERFAVPPPELAPIVTGPVQEVASARDDRGQDVSEIVRARDDRYLDSAGRGPYQGVTRDHFVEIEIPDAAPRRGPLWLVGQGWIHPTDSSINVALGQGSHERPRGLALEVADSRGRFHVVRRDIGFPAGKDKTILVDLEGVFGRTGARRLRLSTNMEIYWDRLGWAVGRPDVRVAPRRLSPASADLRYRGYSRTTQASPSAPERPQYVLDGTVPRWRDLEGYYTRFGDVRELLLAVDDRYVIMNAGDELALRFPEAPPVAGGDVRDFVLIADGWEKDGDFNTTFSRTVLPLPTHERGRYDRPPGRLEDDPVYRRHTADFMNYHTRYVAAGTARDALQARKRDLGR